MAVVSPRLRASVDGKFFRIGEKKFFAKGVAYGPVAGSVGANSAGGRHSSDRSHESYSAQTARDFAQIKHLGANLIRVYETPEKQFLDLAAEHELKVLVSIPWNQHLCFLDSAATRAAAREAVRRAVITCAAHPAIFAYSVANEVPADVVRWSGARAVADFIDELIQEAKSNDPECLCTYANFPPTEFLQPERVDFVCFNVYLHHPKAFRSYLDRLQMLAGSKPLLLGEVGIDSLREGEDQKCAMLAWQIEESFRAGLAGTIIFSYTDDWCKDGCPVQDWHLGLTTRDRKPKDSFRTVQRLFAAAPFFDLNGARPSSATATPDQMDAPRSAPPVLAAPQDGHARLPKVSVIVASYNAERTLAACLDSLGRLNYPDYEVILIDDGSTDTSPQIAFAHTEVRYFRHPKNLGLSVARNTGIAAATGEIVAFTDADCRADEDWLYYLVADLLNGEFVGMGGPNLAPAEDSPTAAVVMASPGGPAHVMLTDRQAEHVPGCNMAFFKWALEQIGGFDPVFHRAGDDVDICWRIEQAGWKIGFSPSDIIWHYRRSTVRDYFKQQQGYGEAEALLVRKHPEYFNSFGGSTWRGRIYTTAKFGLLLRPSIIYRGLFGSAGFQSIYAAEPAPSLLLCTSIEYYASIVLPLWVLSTLVHPLLPLAITSLLLPIVVCAAAAAQAAIPSSKVRLWSRPLVAMLFLGQPIVRGWARYRGRLWFRPSTVSPTQNLDSEALLSAGRSLAETYYWAEPGKAGADLDRLAFVTQIVRRLEQRGWPNRSGSWQDYDVEVLDTRWSKLQITTALEEFPSHKRLLRCRLRPRWSLRARAAFASLACAELLCLGLFARHHPWLWLILLLLPAFAWFLHEQGRSLQSVMAVFLDELARDSGLFKVQSPASRDTEQKATDKFEANIKHQTPAIAKAMAGPNSTETSNSKRQTSKKLQTSSSKPERAGDLDHKAEARAQGL